MMAVKTRKQKVKKGGLLMNLRMRSMSYFLRMRRKMVEMMEMKELQKRYEQENGAS